MIVGWSTESKTYNEHWRMLALVEDLYLFIYRRGWFSMSMKLAQIYFRSKEQDHFVWNLFIRWIRLRSCVLKHSKSVHRLLSGTILSRESPSCGGTCVKLWAQTNAYDIRKNLRCICVQDNSFTAKLVVRLNFTL